jgi:hypothetical protein
MKWEFSFVNDLCKLKRIDGKSDACCFFGRGLNFIKYEVCESCYGSLVDVKLLIRRR